MHIFNNNIRYTPNIKKKEHLIEGIDDDTIKTKKISKKEEAGDDTKHENNKPKTLNKDNNEEKSFEDTLELSEQKDDINNDIVTDFNSVIHSHEWDSEIDTHSLLNLIKDTHTDKNIIHKNNSYDDYLDINSNPYTNINKGDINDK